MGHIKTLGVAVTAFVMGLLVALAIIVFAGNYVSFGVIIAFVTGLVVAVSLSIFAISHSRKSTEA